ncbi:MAG: fibronectin type III domain-containing protein, partial [Acidobacteria bacterium]|nr:fibronectin type III domain-containing protein [Acidobacteriota bacterium]
IDATITVTVSVTDVNEAPGKPDAPTFGAATASSLVVNWTAPSNSGPDISDYDVQYRKGTSGEWSAHDHNGTATTATITGLDAGSAYEVQVRVTNDEGTGEWSESGSGSTAAANAAPSFSSSAAVSVAENQTTVVTVQASDADTQDSVTGYVISGGADQRKFSIVQRTGVLTFSNAPNFEAPTDAGTNNVYNLTVEATSGAGERALKATQDIAVTVTNVNEPPTVSGDATVNYAENGTGVVATYSASDPDAGSSHTWTVEGADAAAFSISGTGALTFNTAPNYEVKTSYAVTVKATDNGTPALAGTLAVTVSVTNVKEPPGKPDLPTFGAATASSLEVNWTAPDNSGPAISDYDVQYRKGTSGEWSAHEHSGTRPPPSLDAAAPTRCRCGPRTTKAWGNGRIRAAAARLSPSTTPGRWGTPSPPVRRSSPRTARATRSSQPARASGCCSSRPRGTTRMNPAP